MKNTPKKSKKEKFIIPLELTDSFTRIHERKVTETEFREWFAEIVFHHHPINNNIFNHSIDKS